MLLKLGFWLKLYCIDQEETPRNKTMMIVHPIHNASKSESLVVLHICCRRVELEVALNDLLN